MDIRTKLALALVSVSLISMGLICTFSYQASQQLLQESSVRQLDALARSKQLDLEKVAQGWKDQLRLIRSSLELKPDIATHIAAGDEAAMDGLKQVLLSAASAVDHVARITLVDADGEEVISVGKAEVYEEIELPDLPGRVQFAGTFLGEQGVLVAFSSLVVQTGEIVAGIEVVFNAEAVYNVTSNHTGLGETGEVLVVTLRNDKTVILLTPLRHETESRPSEIALEASTPAIQKVLGGESGTFIEGFKDYRDESVWAATRFIDELNWGLVVKIDASEEEAKVDVLAETMFDIALALSAFAIIGGTLLGFYLARPIHDLAVLVERIRHGEDDLRAEVKGDDEIAYLAESLNELLDHWQPDDPSDSKPEQGS